MTSDKNFMLAGDDLVTVALKPAFLAASRTTSAPGFAPLKAVIAENGGRLLEPQEALAETSVAMRSAANDSKEKLGFGERLQMKAMSWLFDKLASVTKDSAIEIEDDVTVAVPAEKKEALCAALTSDSRVKDIVLKIA